MNLFDDPAMTRALAAGLLACVACGVVGALVVVKRIALISGGITHASLGGVGIAAYFGIAPILGATVFGLFAAVAIGLVTLRSRESEDTLIAALWAIGMAVGIVFMELTPGFEGELERYLFGDILVTTPYDLLWTAILDVVIVATVFVLYKEFLAVSFDEEFAELRGIPVGIINVLLLCLVTLTAVAMIRVVGVILLIALLTIPAAMGRWFTNRLPVMMGLAGIWGALFVVLGIVAADRFGMPAGPCIVLAAAIAYTVGLSFRGITGLARA